MSENFVSLHNHTEYSFFDGVIKIKDLVRKAKEFDMPAVAITDHGGLFGAVEFYETCQKEGVKPIIGFEAYVAPGSRFEKSQVDVKDERYYSHLILLAANASGWKNLMQLSSIGYLEGFCHKPRIDMEVLRRHSDGIIATSACIAGAIPQAILRGDKDTARKLTEEYISIFGWDNFYFELQDHGIEEEKTAMAGLITLGYEMGVPFIVANDAHYLLHEDALSHELLLCMNTKDTLNNPNHCKLPSDQMYFKSPEEMEKLFPEILEAMTNTLEIAERCNVDIRVRPQLRSVEIPAKFKNTGEYLSHIAKIGLRERYMAVTQELEGRLEYELKVINDMNFADYFLIVLDIVQAAHDMGIMVGCRGSVAGCLVFYAIGVTNVDPIKFGLIFELFLNPERIHMPDADIDFADHDRYKIIDYVVDKYGYDSVCRIISFDKMDAKNIVTDVARTMDISVEEQNRLTKMITEPTLKESFGIPQKLILEKDGEKIEIENITPQLSSIIIDNTLEEYVETKNELTETVLGNNVYRDIFRHAAVLEGLTYQSGMYTGGVIIAPGKAMDWTPLFKQPGAEEIMTQLDINHIEKVGLITMDFWGLNTLTVLQEAMRLIKKHYNKTFDLWKLPYNDEKTLALFDCGETAEIFLFEAPEMREYLCKFQPTGIEDLIAMTSLHNRPGFMDDINMLINRKYGKEAIVYLHPLLEDVLKATYGVIIYQEQIIRIAQAIGRFTLGQADFLRKMMVRKNVDMMEIMNDQFFWGAAKLGIGEKTALEVFDLMAKSAGYSVNKAHATGYTLLSYQAAYLKVHYQLEYMTAYEKVKNGQEE